MKNEYELEIESSELEVDNLFEELQTFYERYMEDRDSENEMTHFNVIKAKRSDHGFEIEILLLIVEDFTQIKLNWEITKNGKTQLMLRGPFDDNDYVYEFLNELSSDFEFNDCTVSELYDLLEKEYRKTPSEKKRRNRIKSINKILND